MDKTQKTILAYNKNAKAFADKFMDFPGYRERVDEFIQFLSPNDQILDLGCGPGNVARQLLDSGKELCITGIDLSEEMIKLARENASAGTFYRDDIRHIQLQERAFDAIILSFCIIHLNDLETNELFEKVLKYLKKNGKIYLSFMEGQKEIFQATCFSTDEIYFNFYVTDRIKAILRNYGMKILRVKKREHPGPDGTMNQDVFIFARKQ